jgi:DNA polymerase V
MDFLHSKLERIDIETSSLDMEISSPVPFEERTSLRLSLFAAKVEAGFPSPADDHLERGIELNKELIRNPAATFFLRVKGDSMRDAGIHAGHFLVIDRLVCPADRQIVAAMVEGEFTVKRLRKQNGKILLDAANSAYQPIEVTEDQELMTWRTAIYIIQQAG